MSDKICVIIADDTDIARQGMRRILATAPDIEIIGEGTTVHETIRQVCQLRPDVLLLDLKWFEDEDAGIEAIERLASEAPETKVIAITVYPYLIKEAKDVGAHAVLSKDISGQQLIREIRSVYAVSSVKRRAVSFNQAVDFVLVTALVEERDAVLDKLSGHRKLPPSKDDLHTYFQAELPTAFPDGKSGVYQIIVMPLLGMGRLQAATATMDAIKHWHPRYIMLVGIAGGMAAQGVRIGDILIADQIVDYEMQRITPQGPQIRWEVHRSDPRLLDACRNFMGGSWRELMRIKRPGRGKSKRHTGPIASGDKVIAFGDVLRRYCEVWPKLIGVEMEAAGVATAAFQSPEKPGFFMVRCASDLADEQKDSAGVEKWRSYACDAAASFAIALLRSGPICLLNGRN